MRDAAEAGRQAAMAEDAGGPSSSKLSTAHSDLNRIKSQSTYSKVKDEDPAEFLSRLSSSFPPSTPAPGAYPPSPMSKAVAAEEALGKMQTQYEALQEQLRVLSLQLAQAQQRSASVAAVIPKSPDEIAGAPPAPGPIVDPLAREMLKDVIRYDGRKEVEHLLQYIGKLDAFFMVVDWTEARKLQLATSKLSGRADNWWRNYRDKESIVTWGDFKIALKQRYTTVDHDMHVRHQLQDLRQTKSAAAYTDAFNILSSQIADLGDGEAISYYLKGLRTGTRKLVESQHYPNGRTLESLQRAALRVGYTDESADKASALMAQTKPKSRKPHSKHDNAQQDRSPQSKQQSQKPRTLSCYLCQEVGHRVPECPALPRLQQQLHSRGKALIAYDAPEDEWVLDSGASDHMARSKDLFDYYAPSTRRVHVGNGQPLSVAGEGGMHVAGVQLAKVLHVPKMHFNLMSVQRLCQDIGTDVAFDNDQATVTRDGEVLLRATFDHVSGLYIVGRQRAHALVSTASSEVWHKRLAHLSSGNMKKLIDMADGITGMSASHDACTVLNIELLRYIVLSIF